MDKIAKILVVDDDDRNLRLIEAMLLPLGHKVYLSHDGEHALRTVQECDPDVILLDVMMPKMDGFEVAKRLKKNTETQIIPVVMVTALRDVEDRVKALEAGAEDFISKPVDRMELIATVNSQLKIKAYNDHMRNYQKELENEVAGRTEQLRRAFEQIKMASLDTIYRLSRAADYRDRETGAHIQRMSQYAATIARKHGLGNEAVEAILYASPMHDIGKIGIPDSILLKKEGLTPREWDIMKQHTVYGQRILEGSDTEYLKEASSIALSHHEKWDGSGYPSGLKGTDIPLSSRIIAVADVFDAITSIRPYREESYSFGKALNAIRELRGTHFDPTVVDTFLAAREEISRIRDKFEIEE